MSVTRNHPLGTSRGRAAAVAVAVSALLGFAGTALEPHAGGGHGGGGGGHASASHGGGGHASSGGGHDAGGAHGGAGHAAGGGHISGGGGGFVVSGHSGGAHTSLAPAGDEHFGSGQISGSHFAGMVHAAPHAFSSPSLGFASHGLTHSGVGGFHGGVGTFHGADHHFGHFDHHFDDHHFFGFDQHHHHGGVFLGLGFGAWPRYDPWYGYPSGYGTVVYSAPATVYVPVAETIYPAPADQTYLLPSAGDDRGMAPVTGGAAPSHEVGDVPLSVPLLDSREAPEALPPAGPTTPGAQPRRMQPRQAPESPR